MLDRIRQRARQAGAHLWRRLRSPVVLRFFGGVAATYAARHGFDLDPGQTALVLGVVLGVGSLDATRKVTPVADPRLPKGRRAGRYE